MGDSLPSTPLNHQEKFDAASFILTGKIRYLTKLQNYKQTNNKRYIHTLPNGMCGSVDKKTTIRRLVCSALKTHYMNLNSYL